MKHFKLLVVAAFGFLCLPAQTGPNSPLSGANSAATGTLPWINPGNVLASDNAYASVSVTGTTNYLVAKSFGFSIGGPATIDGIQLAIEKSEVTPAVVTLSDNWTNGLSKTISAGLNRCLVVVIAMENGNSYRDVTALDYGGQAMTPVFEISAGTTTDFSDRLEVWMLLENRISLASGTTLTPTYAANTLLENVEFFTSAVFQNVDQLNPVYSSQLTASNSSANPQQLSSPINTLQDGMCVSGVICGNNTTPASTTGGTNTYTINSSFVEGTDSYTSNPSFASSGISVQTATKACTVSGTEQPSFTFAGSVNRAALFGFTLQRARALDNAVYLWSSGAIIGTNRALSTASWPTSDAYVTYGSPSDTWGRNWSVTEINSSGFGAALSASRSNGNLQADHFRITVYTTSTLPITLLQFGAAPEGNEVLCKWVTATELNNDYFVVERTSDGTTFKTIGTLNGAGSSTQLNSYQLSDPEPVAGTAYYRLKQVDFNGTSSYSGFVSVNFSRTSPEASVYPNPSADGVFTFLQEDQLNGNEVAVFSSDLRLVKKISIAPGEKASISLAGEADGIYFLIYTENGKQKVNKVQKLSKEN